MMADLNVLYSPSSWSKRLPPTEIIPHHLDFIAKANENIRQNISNQVDIDYGCRYKEKINIFATDLKDDAPIFVFIHGGYWQLEILGRHSYEFISRTLQKYGIKTIFIGYELCPNVTLSEIKEEIEKAAKKCVTYAVEKNSKGLYFAGHSAGGHLTACLFIKFIRSLPKEEQALIKSAIMISGIFDLSPIEKTQANEALHLTQEEISSLSPLKVDIDNGVGTSFYCVVGADESPEFIRQSKEFHNKLNSLGYDSKFVEIVNTDHFDIIENLSDAKFDLTKLIVKIITGM